MTTYILNGFSFLMNQPDEGNIKYKYVSSGDAREMCINATSRVGQKNLAKVLSNEFGFQQIIAQETLSWKKVMM